MEVGYPYGASSFDAMIEQTVPYYALFYQQALGLVESLGYTEASWLDVGCGTGRFIELALQRFPRATFAACDPDKSMVEAARACLQGDSRVVSIMQCPTEDIEWQGAFDVVTAIQCHHYLHEDERIYAEQRCFEALRPGGIFIVFENTAPKTRRGLDLVLDRWKRYQISRGKTEEEANQHIARYDKKYFPITAQQHIAQLADRGFTTVELFWRSYLQAGFYAIRD